MVTPCYNGSRYLGDCVASVKSQTLQDWEMVIVDDGSTDDTADVADKLAEDDGRVRVIHQANRGAAAARNAGAAASAPYLLFLDSDDVLAPAMLSDRHLPRRHPDVAIVHTATRTLGLPERMTVSRRAVGRGPGMPRPAGGPSRSLRASPRRPSPHCS